MGGSVEVVVVLVEAGTADDALEGSVEVVVGIVGAGKADDT